MGDEGMGDEGIGVGVRIFGVESMVFGSIELLA